MKYSIPRIIMKLHALIICTRRTGNIARNKDTWRNREVWANEYERVGFGLMTRKGQVWV